jgi:hypothetical protein
VVEVVIHAVLHPEVVEVADRTVVEEPGDMVHQPVVLMAVVVAIIQILLEEGVVHLLSAGVLVLVVVAEIFRIMAAAVAAVAGMAVEPVVETGLQAVAADLRTLVR